MSGGIFNNRNFPTMWNVIDYLNGSVRLTAQSVHTFHKYSFLVLPPEYYPQAGWDKI